jgi:hypothetical protein
MHVPSESDAKSRKRAKAQFTELLKQLFVLSNLFVSMIMHFRFQADVMGVTFAAYSTRYLFSEKKKNIYAAQLDFWITGYKRNLFLFSLYTLKIKR